MPSAPDEQSEALRRLEERLGRASATAERLIAEAARMGSSDRPPLAGWDAPTDEQGDATRSGGELDLLLQAIRTVRELIPPDVLERLAEALRELLRAIRALIDFYLERLDRGPAEPAELQDIPIR